MLGGGALFWLAAREKLIASHSAARLPVLLFDRPAQVLLAVAMAGN